MGYIKLCMRKCYVHSLIFVIDAVDSGEINMKSDTLDYYSLLQDEPVSEETSFNYKLQKQDVVSTACMLVMLCNVTMSLAY